ncbi:MAG: hypothetical protein V5A76_07860, partial [Candidatus Thermoplasmatota archaeon]
DANVTGDVAGCLVGYNEGTVSNSYATSNVSAQDIVGGLVGENDGGTLSNSYWNIETSGTNTGTGSGSSGDVTGLPTSEMTDYENNYNQMDDGSGNDFASSPWHDPPVYWNEDQEGNMGYPALGWQGGSISGTVYEDDGNTEVSDGTVELLDVEDNVLITHDIETEGASYSFDNLKAEETEYTVEITDVSGYEDDSATVTLSLGEDATKDFILTAALVESIKVTTEPSTLTYDSGDTLDLSGMNVTEYYTDNTTENVTFGDPEWEKNYTATPSNGTLLNGTDHGETVNVTHTNESLTADTDQLIVNHNLTINIKGNGSTNPGEGNHTYQYGTTVSLEAVADTGYHFVEWTGDNGTMDDTIANQTSITMEGDYVVTAEFAINTYTLNISSTAGGSVATPGEGTFTYDHGTVVDLEGVADENYTFIEWTGNNGTIANTKSNQTTIDMLDNYTITAEFLQDPFFDVEIVDYDEEVIEGEEFVVDYTVTNTGDMTDTQDIQFIVYNDTGNEVYFDELKGVKLNGSESYDEGNFSWKTEDLGDYSFEITSEVGNHQEGSLSVEETTSADGVFSSIWWPYLILGLATFAVITGGLLYKKQSTKEEPIIEDIFLISQKNSMLILHNTRRLKPDRDSDILASMFDTVQNFIEDSFQDTGDWELNKLEFGDNKVVVERGEYVYMAVVYEGEFTDEKIQEIRNLIERIENEFEEELKEWYGNREELRGIEEIIQDFFS